MPAQTPPAETARLAPGQEPPPACQLATSFAARFLSRTGSLCLGLTLAACAALPGTGTGTGTGTAPGSTPGRPMPSGAGPAPGAQPGTPGTATTPGGSAQVGGVPTAVRPPAGEKERLRTRARGDFTYECRRHLTQPTRFVWSFVVPAAVLVDGSGTAVAKYYAGPTWEGQDRSKVTGRQLALVRAPGPTDLPLQLVKAEVSTGNGIMKGVRYIQRLETVGGLPSGPCDEKLAGKRQVVPFEATFVFY